MYNSLLKKIDSGEEISEDSYKYLSEGLVDLRCESKFFKLKSLTDELPVDIPDGKLKSILYDTCLQTRKHRIS